MSEYFVGSNGDSPEQLYFDLESAKGSEHTYIDVFDESGMKINSFYLEPDKEEYTDDF